MNCEVECSELTVDKLTVDKHSHLRALQLRVTSTDIEPGLSRRVHKSRPFCSSSTEELLPV